MGMIRLPSYILKYQKIANLFTYDFLVFGGCFFSCVWHVFFFFEIVRKHWNKANIHTYVLNHFEGIDIIIHIYISYVYCINQKPRHLKGTRSPDWIVVGATRSARNDHLGSQPGCHHGRWSPKWRSWFTPEKSHWNHRENRVTWKNLVHFFHIIVSISIPFSRSIYANVHLKTL